MMLYKYVVPKRIDVLQNGNIRFTQAAALNDPFETYPCLTLFTKSLEEHSHGLLKSVEARFDPHSVATASRKIPTMARDKAARWQHNIGADYPMLSLTKEKNNLLMWSHYADSHRGFVIGFDSDNSFFHREKPRKIMPLSKVKYLKKRPILPALEQCEPQAVFEMLFLTKSYPWRYEQELRMFAQPKAADDVKKGPDGLDMYLFSFPPESLREIIFGYRMTTNKKAEVAAAARIDILALNYTRPN